MQAFEALHASGVRYVVDPNSAYESLSTDTRAIDYLRFPLETVAHGAGDCDDLSVLYATLLESVGVDTAFITTPGHIHMAFDIGVEPSELRTLFATTKDFILHGGRAWMPVETTALGKGFTQAWHLGALQWRRASAEEAAGFFTTKAAWEAYAPVAAPTELAPHVPERVVVQAGVREQLDAFRSRELSPRVEELKLRIAEHESPAAVNQLGVLYARYGLLDEASTHFERAGADGYLPALINQANVLTMRGRHSLARQHLERARNAEPENARVLLGLATSYWESGDETRARDAFEAASALSPALAGRYPLFGDPASESGARAGLRGSAITSDWVEDDR